MTQLVGVPPALETGFDPDNEEVQRDPYPHYRWLLHNDPVHRGAQGIWFVSRYADVRAVMNDDRFRRGGIRDFWAQLMGEGPLGEVVRHTVLFQDEPDHGRLRGLVGGPFATRAVRAAEPRISRLVADLLEPVRQQGHLDVINEFAYPFALSVIAEILGLPVEDRDQLRAWSLAIGPTLDLVASPDEIRRGQAAMGELVDYLHEQIARRQTRTGEDLLGVMVAANGTTISTNEILAMVLTLIFAGHETVTNQIGNGLLALIRNPDQLELLRADPDRVADSVEELLRYDAAVQSNSRQLVADLELGGKSMRQGEFVVVLAGAANRDPARFTDPDRLDVTRTEIHPMSFGSGLRFCLGAALARLELKAAFDGLVRLRNLRLAVPEEDLVYQRSTMFRGLLRLPITFTPATREGES